MLEANTEITHKIPSLLVSWQMLKGIDGEGVILILTAPVHQGKPHKDIENQ